MGAFAQKNTSRNPAKNDYVPEKTNPVKKGGVNYAREAINNNSISNNQYSSYKPTFFYNNLSKGTEIYNNGPIVNSTGTGAGGYDESVMQSSLGLTTWGFGFQLSGTTRNRVADDFYINATSWDIDSIVFFGYQTGSGLTSTFTSMNVRIWNGMPGIAGSTVVWGDTTTNVLLNSRFSGVYRISEGATGNTDRPVMRLVCNTAGLSLSGGSYWVDYQAEGSGSSGPWAVPVTINGQANTGNAIQRASFVWASLLDDVYPQGLPFIVYGTVNGAFADDIGVTSIVSPVSSANLTGTENIEVVITNYGSNDQTAFPVVYSINGQTPVVNTFSGNLAANTSANFVFSTTGDFSAPGQIYDLKAYTDLSGDQMHSNDTAFAIVQNLYGVVCEAGASTCDEYIESVTFSDISNLNSGCGLVDGYSDFTSDTAHIVIGNVYTINVYNPEAYSGDIVGVWFDWNHNGDLTDAGEFYQLVTTDGGLNFSANITVPNWAINGDALMRIRIQYGGTLNPCGITSYGEVEDYTINVSGLGVACDVMTTSIDVSPALPVGSSIDPKATFKNLGYDVQTFDVTMTVTGGYSSTKTVTALAAGASQQITFDQWTPPMGNYTITVYSSLACDVDKTNDTLTINVDVLAPKMVYLYVAYDPTDALQEGPATSYLQIPGTITSLAATTSDEFITGGTWAENKWYAVENKNGSSGGRLYTIDTVTGAMTVVGQTGVDLNGISYDPLHKIMYGIGDDALYTINIAAGGASFVGSTGVTDALFVGLACNTQGELYALNIDDSKLYKINPSTGVATVVGSVGFNASYAQDMEFDNNTGILYLAAYNNDTDAGELRTCNTTTGASTLIGPFMNNSEICGFAISYPPITSVAEYSTDINLTIYPNPANDIIYINSNEIIKNVKIINILGQVVYDINTNAAKVNINSSSLNKGAYFIQIDTEKGNSTSRIIINR